MGAEKFRRLPFLSLPPGGKVAPKGPDEGAGFGLHLLYAGEFRRLRAASFFPSDGKETKGSPGDGSRGALRAHSRPPYPLWPFGPSPPDRGSRPRTPVTGVTPWTGQSIFGAQNLSDTLNSRRATGPWVCKNCIRCGPNSAPGFAEQVIVGLLSAGRPVSGPYEKEGPASRSAVGAAHWAARRPPAILW